jgi:undecaprenyl diphosphate synthase
MQSNLAAKADTARLHVGIIMDGNGRWATRRGLSRLRGHEAGVEAIRRVVEAAPEQGVGTLTLYAFSSDNWRPKTEVSALMALLRSISPTRSRRWCATASADRDRPPRPSARRHCRRDRARRPRPLMAMRCICASQSTIPRATPSQCRGPRRRPHASHRENFSELIANEPNLRDVDLIIRTSGEKRLSDFLLWEGAYAELHFTERMWPEFEADDLAEALGSFRRRERRFGGLQSVAPEQVPSL